MSQPLNQAVLNTATCPAGRKQVELWDSLVPGLGLRVSYGGAKTWTLLYRIDGKRKRMDLGSAATMSVAQARDAARQVLGVRTPMRPVSNGEGSQTVNDLAALFLSRLNVRPRTEYEYRRMLRFDVLPALGSKPVAAIARADIFTVLDRITGRGARIIANRTHQLLVALLNVAVDRGWVAVNVARGIRRPGGREKPRERALTLVELARIWRATGELRPATRDVIRLLMLTAARRSEVHGMRWEELIGPAGAAMWRIPGSRMKNGRELSRHLSGPAVTILEGYEQQDSGKVFTRVPMDLAGVVKELCARCGITPPAHVHDIRRSVATVMATQDTPPHVLRLILGHVDSSMLARYNVHKYEIEAADAYERFAKALLFQVERMQFKQAETVETTS